MTGCGFADICIAVSTAAMSGCSTVPNAEELDTESFEATAGETGCDAFVCVESMIEDHSSPATTNAWTPPLPLVVGLFGFLKIAWRWLKGAVREPAPVQEDPRSMPTLPPAKRISERPEAEQGPIQPLPYQPIPAGWRPYVDGSTTSEQALICWREVEAMEIREMIFRGGDRKDSIVCGLIAGTMIYLIQQEKGLVPQSFRDAPYCLVDCEDLLSPDRAQLPFAQKVIEVAGMIDEIMSEAEKGPAVLVLIGADYLSSSGIAAPINGVIVNALERSEVRRNLLRLATVTTPGWDFSDLRAAHRENGFN